MKTNFHEQEAVIMKEWLQMAQSNHDADELCVDGLLFRGDISYSNGCWHREPGNEEQAWAEAPRRLLILTKDLHDDEAWDIRQETGRMNSVAFSYERAIPFYKNLRMWSYLLLSGAIGAMPLFETARDMRITGPFYETAPIARVNCKKQVGGAMIPNAVFMHYLTTYVGPLARQIALYDANILVCCGCTGNRNLMLDFVRSQYLTDLQLIPDTGNWIYYSPLANKIAVNSYHPSARVGYQSTYEDLADAYEAGLEHIAAHYGAEF